MNFGASKTSSNAAATTAAETTTTTTTTTALHQKQQQHCKVCQNNATSRPKDFQPILLIHKIEFMEKVEASWRGMNILMLWLKIYWVQTLNISG